jgi:tetratricopeptide (TPR) repeat protein
MSTNGRFLILKISCKHIKEYFWFGTGLGRFTNLYPLWQQDYFKLHPNLYNNEFVVAGETYVAFNDILQFFVEIGFLRFAIFVIAMYKFFRLKSSYYTILLLYIKLSVGIMLISALTTYTFHITILLTFLALCISFSISISTKTEKETFCINYLGLRKPFFLIMLGTTYFAIYKLAQESNAIYKWKLTKANVSIEEKYQLYFSAYSYLSTNGKFLKDYGKILFIKGEYQKAILIFQQSLLYYNNFETYELLALVYEYQGDLENAILQYQYLANYVPHKFTPKYKIFQLYLKSKKYKEAKKIGDILLSMPIKIPSQTIDDIKKEVSIFMNSKML